MKDKDKVTEFPTADPDDEAGGEQEKPQQSRVIGYIISPDVMVGLLDVCEDIPGRYYKKIVPALQSSSQLVEDEDGKARVINAN